ncbi:polysaccharide deacetylase family protein [Kineococcus gypseus]|uniref:polysaccharide deacetylase family protein n=1 Tax=Kineococcus gypseus TaxID=1637102 RepID=UPI003D7E7ADC
MQLSEPRPTRSRRARRLTATALAATAVAALATGPAQAKNPTPEVVTSTQSGGKSVSFTFDDGPNGDDPYDAQDANETAALLDVLRENRVKATFCLWGDHVQQYPDLVRRIAAEGHTLCNHTMHHDFMGAKDPEAIRAELRETSALIRSIVPNAKIPFFRAPYGDWGADGRVARVAAEEGMQPLGWRFVISDWEPATAEQLAQRVRDQLTPGAVALMHDGGGDRTPTVDAVATLIPELKAAGWHFSQPEIRVTTAETGR